MRIQRIVLAVLGSVLLLLPHPSYAQEDAGLSAQEQEWLVYVQGAFDNFAAATSFSVHGEQLTNQTLTSPALGAQAINTSLDQKFDTDVLLDAEGQVLATSSGLDQTSVISGVGVSEVQQVMIMETVVVDGVMYVVVPDYEDSTGGSSPFPSEWINLTENADQFPGLQSFDIKGLTDYSSRLMPFGELTDEILLHITEGDSIEIEGQTVRVFELDYDMVAVAAAGGFGLGQIYSDQMSAALGLSGDELVRQLFESATMHQTIWIDPATQLPSRIKATLQIDANINSPTVGAELHIVQTTDSVQELSQFNEPLTIEAPIEE